jgi:sigma-E factor negative regulatory protein RseC
MKEIIEHQGVIESIEGGHVRVNIVQLAACSGCKARSMCTSSESKEKIIDVYETGAENKYKVGENVNVCGTLSMGRLAVVLAFGIPLVIIAVWMIVAIAYLKFGELFSVGILAVILAAYFYVLYLNKDRMAKNFSFWIADA